jgi:hypothetical protein
MFAQLFRSLRDLRPRNQDYLNSSVTGMFGRVSGVLPVISVLYCIVRLLFYFKQYTVYLNISLFSSEFVPFQCIFQAIPGVLCFLIVSILFM